MKIKGAWIHTPLEHKDDRGSFKEQFKSSRIESELGRAFDVKQVNHSVSNRGVVRGIHFTDGLVGQAKYVSCVGGAIWDVVIDLRVSSSTYGQWDAVELSSENGLSVFISEGLGHAFLSLVQESAVTYLCNAEYNDDLDKGFHPFSASLGIPFEAMLSQNNIDTAILSKRDASLPPFSF